MKFTGKDLLQTINLEIGDKIILWDNVFEICRDKDYDGIILKHQTKGKYCIESLIGYEFEKVEKKIWGIDDIEIGDKFFYVDYSITDIQPKIIRTSFAPDNAFDLGVVERDMAFTKKKYAQKYLQELKEFNKNYKKELLNEQQKSSNFYAERDMAFANKEYAQKYLQTLKKFNKNYKKELLNE